MITTILFLLIGLGIVAVFISAFFRIIRFIVSLPIIGTLAVVLILIFIFFGI